MEENKYVDLFKKHYQKILMALLLFACAGVWGERLMRGRKHKQIKQIVDVQNIFTPLLEGRAIPASALARAEKLLKKNPELHAKYDGLLALAYLEQNNPEKASIYAKQSPCDFHRAFATTSKKIIAGHFETALIDAKELDAQLQTSEYHNLYAYNLARIALLSKKMGHHENTQEAFSRLSELEEFELISSLFTQGNLTLSDYLKSES